MNIRTFEIVKIGRMAAHTIIAKTVENDAKARLRDVLLEFDAEETDILKERLTAALRNFSKTFQLEFEEKGDDSVYQKVTDKAVMDDAAFLAYSRTLAQRLASAHFRINIPGGHCLVGEGTAKGKIPFFFVVKAELQEVFNIENNALHLIKDVFLSPAKDLYKIAIFFKEKSGVTPFMYDDQFSLQKRDLTEYFYSNFLGLTTEKNDRLRSKNFYERTKEFAERNLDNAKDRFGIIKALDVLYREDTSGIISPEEFSNNYFEGELKEKYDQMVSKEFPTAFTKDISLVENRAGLQRSTIPLSYSMEIVGDARSLLQVEVIDDPNADQLNEVEIEINNGNVRQLVVLKEAETEPEAEPEPEPEVEPVAQE